MLILSQLKVHIVNALAKAVKNTAKISKHLFEYGQR